MHSENHAALFKVKHQRIPGGELMRKQEIIIKIGTHSLQCVYVCRKRKDPIVGEIIHIKRNHFAKEERIRIIGIPTYSAMCYFGELA
jgi:hypothetical protein